MTIQVEAPPSPDTSTADDLQDEVALSNHETEEAAAATEAADLEETWPEAFYCQRTHILMTDPLVGPDGSSIDRSAIDEGDATAYYPNRALQAIVQETMTLRKHPFRASLKQLQQSMSQGLSNLLPEWTSPDSLFRPLNDAFYCPITYNLMHEPVIDPEGNTFERVAIQNWILFNHNSPITRTDLSTDQLYPNTAIKKLLQEEKERPEDQMHPAIRKWKDEPVPTASDLELGGGQVVERQQYLQGRPPAQPGTTLFIVINTSNGIGYYPTTPLELAQRDTALRRSMDIFVAGGCVCSAVFSLMAYLVFGITFYLIFFVLTVGLALYKIYLLRRSSS
jgi:hypothetical protein